MNNKIKLLLLGTLLSLFGLSTVLAAGPSDCKNPQDWRNFGGFTHTTCPNGLGYPTMNAYKDEQIFPGSYLKAFEFAMVRKTNNNNQSRPNDGFTNQATLENPNEKAQFFVYAHNSGNPNCNTTNSSVLSRNNCSQSTIAENVRLKITGGLQRQSDGTIKSQPGARHVITFQITSRNTTPRTIQDSIVITTPANKVLTLSQNPTDNQILNEDNVRHSFVSDSLLDSGIRLSSSYATSQSGTGTGSGSLDFYGSEGYRLRVLGVFSFEDAPETTPLACEELTLTKVAGTNSNDQTYNIGVTPQTFSNQVSYTIKLNPDTTAGLEKSPFPDQDTLKNFTRPTVRLSDNKSQIRIQNPSQYYDIFVQIAGTTPECSKVLKFPTTPPTDEFACENLTFGEIEQNADKTKATVPFKVQPAKLRNKLECTVTGGGLSQISTSIWNGGGQGNILLGQITENTVLNCEVPEEDGTVNPSCKKTLDFEPTKTPTEELACKSFELNITEFEEGSRPAFKVQSIQPADFKEDVVWTINGENQKRQKITATFTPTTALKATDVVEVKWIKHTTADNCIDTAKSKDTPIIPPEETEKCEELIVRDSRGNRVTNKNSLPGAKAWESYTIRTNPSKFVSEIEVSGSRLNLTKDDETYYVFNAQPGATLEFDGPDKCNLELTKVGGGNEIKVTKQIKGTNSQGNFRNEYDFADVGKPVQYRVIVDSEEKLPRDANLELEDDIARPIPGRNKEKGNQVFGSLIQNSNFRANEETFTYTGVVRWDNRNQDCSNFNQDCSVQYRNQARVIIEFPGDELEGDNQLIIESNPTYAIVLCPFILSRGFGDVFLDKGFDTGVNVQACGARNTESPVFTPAPAQQQQIVSTGSEVKGASHAICEAARQNPNSLPKELKEILTPENLKNFSSSVCQVAINNAERWKKSEIEKNLKAIFNRLAPANLAQNGTLSEIPDKPQNKNSRIASYTGLTIQNSNDVLIQGNSARTIVVYGDLNINSNLKYAPNSSGTVAFVVIGGDIKVKAGVTELQGIFVTIKDQKGGAIKWSTDKGSPTAIVIKGSAYGDIQPLFNGVTASGSLLTDRGGVTVIFDGRVTRKIPPGLQDVIKFNQFQTATQSNYFNSTQ